MDYKILVNGNVNLIPIDPKRTSVSLNYNSPVLQHPVVFLFRRLFGHGYQIMLIGVFMCFIHGLNLYDTLSCPPKEHTSVLAIYLTHNVSQFLVFLFTMFYFYKIVNPIKFTRISYKLVWLFVLLYLLMAVAIIYPLKFQSNFPCGKWEFVLETIGMFFRELFLIVYFLHVLLLLDEMVCRARQFETYERAVLSKQIINTIIADLTIEQNKILFYPLYILLLSVIVLLIITFEMLVFDSVPLFDSDDAYGKFHLFLKIIQLPVLLIAVLYAMNRLIKKSSRIIEHIKDRLGKKISLSDDMEEPSRNHDYLNIEREIKKKSLSVTTYSWFIYAGYVLTILSAALSVVKIFMEKK